MSEYLIENMSTEALKELLENIIYGKERNCEGTYLVREALRILYELIKRND